MKAREILDLLRLSDVRRIAKMKGVPRYYEKNKKQLIGSLMRRKNPILMVGNPKRRKNPILMVGNPKPKTKKRKKRK